MIKHPPTFLPCLISYSKKLSGLAGLIDFDILQLECQTAKSNFEPICIPLVSAPQIWMSKLGGIVIGCFSRLRPVGDIIKDPKDGLRILAYTGNLTHRKNDLLRILAGDELLIKELNEIFSLVLWDQNKNEIKLVTDRYGNLPIYYQCDKRRLIFGSEAKTVLLLSGHSASLNREVLEEILWFGCPLTEQTLFQGINKVSPATMLSFTPQILKTENYWNIKFSCNDSIEKIKLIDKAEQTFRSAIKRACSFSSRSAMALTGGIDTRIMLAEVINLGIKIDAFTAGLINSADMKMACRLNRYIKGTHHKLIIDDNFLRSFEKYAYDTVWLSEGGILLQDNQLIYLNEFCRERFDLLLDGGCIEISKRGPLRRISRSLNPNDNLCEILMNKWGNNQLLRTFFESVEIEQITNRIRLTLETLLTQTKQRNLGDSIDAFFLRVVWPNRYGPQVALQNNYLEGQLPFLDYNFMDAILQLPCSWREQCMFHFYVVSKCAPKLKQYGRVHFDMFIPWTDNYYLKYLFPVLNLFVQKLGFNGFARPNFPYQKWWRNELQELVKSWMPSLANRGVLDRKGFNEIMKPKNISRPIFDIAASRLGMIELWCKNFLDINNTFY